MQRKTLQLKYFALAASMAMALAAAATTANAEDGIYVPQFSYRTGPYSGAGTAIFNGLVDYLNMLNERDGGVGGARLIVTECETGYDTKRGVECYEQVKGRSPVVVNPYSTGITLQLIPKAAVDKIPILSMAYGLSASADGNLFPWVFNPPATYWDGASAFIRYVAQQEGGFGKLKGKTIGLVHLDAPYGKEPIPLLQALAKDYGFTLKTYPVPPQQMQNQTALWLDIRRDRPDWIYLQGWGAMNPTAFKEAAKIDYPMNHLVGVWWSGGEDDVRPAGPGAKGYLALAISGVGQDYPAIQDILKYVVDKGKSQTPRDKVGEILYDRGVMNAVLIAEGIRAAQQLTGKKKISGDDMRRGMERLNITEARWKELGLPNFAAPIQLSCADHNGHNGIYLVQWDGAKWNKASDWLPPLKDKVMALINSAAAAYVKANAGWPKRTEPCDRSS
jgi:branched-chain amino acid transport system substrate-binding protein